jgi:hypothetical protein
MRCALCHQPIDLRSAWKGTRERFYCSEFCADSEGSVAIDQNSQKRLIDRRYVERLERLLPLMQTLQAGQ